MEIIDIKNALKTEKVTNIKSEELLKILFNSVLKVYILHGLMRSRAEAEVKAEIAIFAEQIKQDILSDSKLMNLRTSEIDLIFKSGLNDEFGKVEWISYTVIKRWINSYIYSSERKDALMSLDADLTLKQLAPVSKFSEKEVEQFMKNKINENYALFLTNSDEVIIGIGYENKLKFGAQKWAKMGQIIDYGDAKNNFLVKLGLKTNSETLYDFYERMKKENKTKIF